MNTQCCLTGANNCIAESVSQKQSVASQKQHLPRRNKLLSPGKTSHRQLLQRLLRDAFTNANACRISHFAAELPCSLQAEAPSPQISAIPARTDTTNSINMKSAPAMFPPIRMKRNGLCISIARHIGTCVACQLLIAPFPSVKAMNHKS